MKIFDLFWELRAQSIYELSFLINRNWDTLWFLFFVYVYTIFSRWVYGNLPLRDVIYSQNVKRLAKYGNQFWSTAGHK
jgi:hypothetical protein